MLSSNKSLSFFNRSLWVSALVFIIFSLTFFLYVRAEKAIDKANKQRLVSHQIADELRQSSDDLTRMVRTYIMTGDPLYKQHYQEILDIRNGVKPRPLHYENIYWDLVLSDDKRPTPAVNRISLLDIMMKLGFTSQEFALLSEAKSNSDQLNKIEFNAMRVFESTTPYTHANQHTAFTMLHDNLYHQAKYTIMRPINDAQAMMNLRTLKAVHDAEKIAFFMRLVFICFGIILIWTVWHIYRSLYQTLGGSLALLHSHITKIGSGNFSTEIPINKGMEESILGWLSQTQHKLVLIDTERKKNESQSLKLSQVVEQSSNAIVITDSKANIEYVNIAFEHMTGYTRSEAIGQNPRFLKSGKTSHSVYEKMWMSLAQGDAWNGELVNRRKDGSEYVNYTHITPVLDSDGKTTHYVAIEEDITERKRSEERINYLANFDVLTGLPNRPKMDDHLRYTLSLAKRHEGNFAILFLDLDHFKDINDTLGHRVGDLMLIELAKRLTVALRDEDTVSRMGGDEFILLLPDSTANGAALVAQKLLESIAQPFSLEDHALSVTASIGIALYPSDGSDIEILSKNADVAMYRAKQEGRNAYCFFTQEMQQNSQRKLQLSNALHTALQRDELHVVYQPQVSASRTHIVGAEALLRWQHPEFGNISPAEFIPIAEENGMIIPMGEWVLRTAISQIKSWITKGQSPIVMAVNLSAIQFRHPNLPNLITSILAEVDLPPEYLELELTEGIAMYNPELAIGIMNDLHERGIRMSIDDFGTGYSSLAYLKKFKIYKLKIDQSFVRDISTDTEDKAIVSAIIHMAHSLGLQTIAEGVETIAQLNYLQEQGCDEIQGYYYSKPLLPEMFEIFLKEHNN